MSELRIGTSGWHYRHWKGPFYPANLPASKMLDFYLRHFDAVEINNSFYRLPLPGALEAWRQATPAGFRFAAKASRFLTHNKKLKEPENALQNFLPRIETLGEKLGPILFQLPPSWKCNTARLEQFLAVLPRRHRYAFEFRETSWICDAVLELLRRYNAAFCIYEIAGYHSPLEVTANWTYVRLHGPGGKYQGSYSDEQLQEWARQVLRWRPALGTIHVYFDNDQAGYAAVNALRLKQMVAQRLEVRAA
ncbi:MAG: DUF72 domain-containing protein [Acidobacteria bacterium]|nr:DUF72 domain-containing protein [Acidobacteriota bacterium]